MICCCDVLLIHPSKHKTNDLDAKFNVDPCPATALLDTSSLARGTHWQEPRHPPLVCDPTGPRYTPNRPNCSHPHALAILLLLSQQKPLCPSVMWTAPTSATTTGALSSQWSSVGLQCALTVIIDHPTAGHHRRSFPIRAHLSHTQPAHRLVANAAGGRCHYAACQKSMRGRPPRHLPHGWPAVNGSPGIHPIDVGNPGK